MKEKLVIDANIIVKLFKQEKDSDTAMELFRYVTENAMLVLAPNVIINEVATTLEVNKIPIEDFIDMVKEMLSKHLLLVSPSLEVIEKTLEVTKIGHEKSGFPTFNDSMYHATALLNDCIFITADRRHIAKTDTIGKVVLLENWKKVI